MNNRKRKLKQKKKEKLNIIMSLIGLVCVQFIVVGLVIVVVNSINLKLIEGTWRYIETVLPF